MISEENFQPEPDLVLEPEPEVVLQPEPEVVLQPEPDLVLEPEPEVVLEPEPDVESGLNVNEESQPEASTKSVFNKIFYYMINVFKKN